MLGKIIKVCLHVWLLIWEFCERGLISKAGEPALCCFDNRARTSDVNLFNRVNASPPVK